MFAARTASRPPFVGVPTNGGRRFDGVSKRSLVVTLIATLGLGLGCPKIGGNGSAESSNYPPASVYEIDPEFAGEWGGDVDGFQGTLMIGELDDRTFFGSFVTDDGSIEYTLLLDHTYVETEEGGEAPSNRVTFTWQDGLGSRGKGWLRISVDDTALDGSFGYGVATRGLGLWRFERVQSQVEAQ